MSRKRILKKRQKRQESALTQLEELYLRGAVDEFLALAAEQLEDPAASPLAAEWAEMADRALRQSLARADLGRIERLLPILRRGGPLRPLALLAEAVLDLAKGRLEAARSRLATLAESVEGAPAAIPQDLLAGLQSLARDGLQDLRNLAAGCPRDLIYIQAAGELFDALRSSDPKDLARSLEAVREASREIPDGSGELHRVLDGAGRCLSLLADLAVLEDKLARLPQSDRSPASQMIAGWLRGPGPLLTAVLNASAPAALLAPLHRAVRMRWRAVLERVAAREGPSGLAALCAADPRLLAGDVSLPGGIQAGLARLRQGAQARQILAAGRYADLAQLLRSRSLTEPEPTNLAVLWNLELWAINHRTKKEETEAGWLLGLVVSEPPPHRAVVRLQEMAGEIVRRFPAEQRAGVARALRDELLDLSEQIHLCEHMAQAALSLLEHQPGDIGLRIIGVAGAISGKDSRTLRALERWLARGIKVQADDAAIAERSMTQVGRETPETIVRALDLLKPLFDEEKWPAIAALVAREMGAPFADALNETTFAAAFESRRAADRELVEMRRHLDRLRPALGGTPGFAAMELALDCWQPDRSVVEKRVKAFLRASPGLEAVLAAFLVVNRVTADRLAPRGTATALHALAHALIDLLDERWQIWEAAVPALAMATRGRHLQRLEAKIRELLASPRLVGGREALERALRTVQATRNARAGRSPNPDPPRAEPKPKPKPRRRRAGTPQIGLNFF